MLNLRNVVLDNYDDPTLQVLLERHGVDGVRAKFASVQIPDIDELDGLDDQDFGAIFYHPEKVASDDGQRRVWPIHEPGVCSVSVDYFMKVAAAGNVFPDEVRNQIACNIVMSADLHGVDVPDEMRKWADDHGDWIPDDQWVNVVAYDPPHAPVPQRFAFEKVSSAGTSKLYPLDTAELVEASLDEFTKVGVDIHGLTDWQMRIVANQLVKAAEEHGVSVPSEVELLATLRQKTAEEIHGGLLWRVERIPERLRSSEKNRAKIAAAVELIESEEDPIKMAARIAEFDLALGFGEEHYAAGLARPEQVVFEPAEKLAEAEVPLLDKIGRERVREFLGDDVLSEFEKDAEAALASQPSEIQELLVHG